MKLSKSILGAMMLAGSAVYAQTDTIKTDSTKVTINLEDIKHSPGMKSHRIIGTMKFEITHIGPAGEVTTRRNCPACGMG